MTSTRLLAGSAGLALLLGMFMLFALAYGQVTLAPADTLAAIAGQTDDATAIQIVRDIRLPRIAAALVAGAGLGVAGILMQALFRNPVADAWSLGLLAGGQLGVALTVAAAAFAGPAAVAFLTLFKGPGVIAAAGGGVALTAFAMLGLGRRVGAITLLVVGLMLGFLAQGLTSVLLHFAARAGARVYAGWQDASFAGVTPADLAWLGALVAGGLLLAGWVAKPLTTLLLGETYAQSLGTNLGRLRLAALAATVLLVAPVVAFCGPVSFIGLIAPHIARAVAGSARVLPTLPLAGLAGATLAVAGDAVVHLPWEQHFLHLNAILAIIGAPVVILLLVASAALKPMR